VRLRRSETQRDYDGGAGVLENGRRNLEIVQKIQKLLAGGGAAK